MNLMGEELDQNCTPLLTFQESLQKVFSTKLGSQAYQMAASLSPLASNRLSSMSRSLKSVLVTGAIGVVVYVSISWMTRRRRSEDRGSGARTRRPRNNSFRSANVASDCGSVSSTPYRSYNWIELQKHSVSDQESIVSSATLVDGTQLAPQQLGLMGMEALETVIAYWEDALAAYNPTATSLVLTTSEESEFRRSVEEILDLAYQLQDMSETLFIHQNSVLNKRDAFLQQKQEMQKVAEQRRSPSISRRTTALSVSSLDDVSFVSAEDSIADLRDFDENNEPLDLDKLVLYKAALEVHETSGIPYRVMRTDFLGCASDTDYLAKLHCLRLAFREIMKDNELREWWTDNGRIILVQLLVKSDKDPKDFLIAFDDMIEYLTGDAVVKQMEEELSSRNVRCINFYDVCLDYILIDSFEDLESPPSSVLAVMKNRWLSNSFKESALQTALWSVFQAKRRLLVHPNGFKSKFYNVSEILTPSLAWAFFGPDEHLCKLMNEFKTEVLGFLGDIFSFGRVDYSSLEKLRESVMTVAQERLGSVQRKLEE
ncbi:mitoguardin [Eurytemora carolleeae]|uniref:mitoguardin n=1 Tax=Eurytemora carolleeae TaxID=1294199 RepID=UPI000C7599E3|nr:mitoguardin [Eurytemora carolleeae]|eukprot:XP_023325632.1 mitoguardin-like [Eurytemora affinis]